MYNMTCARQDKELDSANLYLARHGGYFNVAALPVQNNYGGSREDDRHIPTLVYLETSQDKLGGNIACPTIAVTMCYYLMYSETPKSETIVTMLKNGVTDWIKTRTPKNMSLYEHANEPFRRSHRFTQTMAIHEDFSGLMISDRVKNVEAQLPEQYRDPSFLLRRSLREAVQHIADSVMAEVAPSRARAFVFARSLFTIAVCLRKTRDGQMLRFDLVDSHRRIVSEERRNGSAVHIYGYGIDDLLYFMERLFPPATNLKSLHPEMERIFIEETGETFEFAREVAETDYSPAALYSITVFKPLFDTPAQMLAATTSTGMRSASPDSPSTQPTNIRIMSLNGSVSISNTGSLAPPIRL
jgi:hypothetical protein